MKKIPTVLTVALTAVLAVVSAGSLAQKPSAAIYSNSPGASYSGGFRSGAPLGKAATAVAPASAEGTIHTVTEGQSIQRAVEKAQPGDTVRVMPGTYRETIFIDKDNIRLSGVIEQGRWPVLEGDGRLHDAILYSGNSIVIENFTITHYKGNGIMGQAGNNFEIRNNIIIDTGVYGIFPQLGKNGLVEHNILSGIEDAAIYIGMSDNIHVAHNEVFGNVAGIEIENSRHAIVENNYVHDNTGGILAFISPGLPIKTTYDVIIRNNFVINNNIANFAAPGSTVSGIPAGTGILLNAADQVVIENNIISNNKTAGILISDHANAAYMTIDPEVDPNSDQVMILNNLMTNNGYDTIAEVRAVMTAHGKEGNPDIIRVGPSKGSCILNRHRYISAGVDDFALCDFGNTANIDTYLLKEPAPARVIAASEQGKYAYLGICSGCHSYKGRLIGPPIEAIQAMYMNNPQGLADYIAKPTKKRSNYPDMPPQDYLQPEVRLAVANYLLSLSK